MGRRPCAGAKGRTSDNLGTDYPVISEALWTAVQNALSGAATPQDALDARPRQAAESATKLTTRVAGAGSPELPVQGHYPAPTKT